MLKKKVKEVQSTVSEPVVCPVSDVVMPVAPKTVPTIEISIASKETLESSIARLHSQETVLLRHVDVLNTQLESLSTQKTVLIQELDELQGTIQAHTLQVSDIKNSIEMSVSELTVLELKNADKLSTLYNEFNLLTERT
jgi:chromosome segregation ATPase